MANKEHTYGGQWKGQKKIKLKDLIKSGGMEVIPNDWYDNESPKRAGKKSIDATLPIDKEMVFKAEVGEGEADRGVLVKWRKKGGYEIKYWYENPDNIVPIGLKADGTSKGKSVKKVTLEYHPDKD